MTPSGAAYWLAGVDSNGGNQVNARGLYRSASASPGDVTLVLARIGESDGVPTVGFFTVPRLVAGLASVVLEPA